MTKSKREPFAKAVALKYSTSGGQTYGVEVLGFKLAGNFNETGAMLRAMGINARVDEEVRKAVEEFRERAARSVEVADLFEDVENGCPAEMPEATRPGFSAVGWIAKKIRALPTEPEGK